jgi:hypothetical protein
VPTDPLISAHMAALARKSWESGTSAARAESARRNGRKGGRPAAPVPTDEALRKRVEREMKREAQENP